MRNMKIYEDILKT